MSVPVSFFPPPSTRDDLLGKKRTGKRFAEHFDFDFSAWLTDALWKQTNGFDCLTQC